MSEHGPHHITHQRQLRRSRVRALALRQQGNAMMLEAWSTRCSGELSQDLGTKSPNGFGDRLGLKRPPRWLLVSLTNDAKRSSQALGMSASRHPRNMVWAMFRQRIRCHLPKPARATFTRRGTCQSAWCARHSLCQRVLSLAQPVLPLHGSCMANDKEGNDVTKKVSLS
jgi:hypothetical protein